MPRILYLTLSIALATRIAAATQPGDWTELIRQGGAAEASGKYENAAAAYREAARITDTFEPGDPRRAFTLNNLGMALDALGRFADAEQAYRRALTFLSHPTGSAQLDRAMILANLSTVYTESGQPSRAEKLLAEARSILAQGNHDPLRQSIVENSLAELLVVKGRYADAEPLLVRCLAVLEQRSDAWSETGIARNNLGVVRIYQGRFAEAIQLLEASRDALQTGRGPDHPILVRTMNNLAAARFRNGDTAEAGRLWSDTVNLAATQLGAEHPLFGEILANYARYLRATGNQATGKALENRASRILRDSQRRNGVGSVIDVSAFQQRGK